MNRLGTEEHKLLLTSMRKAVYDCPRSFGKVRSGFDTIHLSCREAAPRLWDKGWEDKLREAGGIIRQLSKISNSPLKATGISGKEYYRERKKCCSALWRTGQNREPIFINQHESNALWHPPSFQRMK